MKTVFKEGMKVYDQLMFPDVEGVVTSTNFIPEKSFFDKEKDFEEDYEHPYPIEVDFKGEQALYKNDGSGFMDFPTLSTKPYEIEFQGFEQKAPAPTFEEAWEETDRIYEPKSEYDKEEFGGYPSQELANAAEALRRLLFLRDYYNDGWQPNKKDKEQRGVSVTLDCDNNFMVWGILKETEPYKFIFKDDETAYKFLEEQKELLEIAKPLL
jgi:hypothetical protein|nr:MAG TPA: hypothetical protein [Caudoviricetes sp.]